MKFETPIGLGEICVYGENKSRRPTNTDILVKVVQIQISKTGVMYMVEHVGQQFGVQRFPAEQWMLEGDPDYDQEIGDYPEGEA